MKKKAFIIINPADKDKYDLSEYENIRYGNFIPVGKFVEWDGNYRIPVGKYKKHSWFGRFFKSLTSFKFIKQLWEHIKKT